MMCLDGYSIHPSPPGEDYSSLGEAIFGASGTGTIASWSPTGLGMSAGHEILDAGLFRAIFAPHLAQLGPATMQAKLHLHGSGGGYRELFDTYLLFGDPTLRLNLLKAELGIFEGD
jgi:hypothetical protein